MDWIEERALMRLLQLLADFGMCLVLWIVQLVIYPSFLRLQPMEIVEWHRTYTFRISFVIMPCMLTQLAIGVARAYMEPSEMNITYLSLVLITWTLTFFVSVPLHNKVSRGEGSAEVFQSLVRTNWPRTLLWSGIFGLSLYRYLNGG